jgi:predicted MPP superfamily phosphohydrolase
MHFPEGVRDLSAEKFDIAFCGHTHGGQIALPGGRPILLPKGVFVRTYIAGEYRIEGEGSGMLIVSRGVGCDFLPLRIFSPSEILLCEIAGPDPASSPPGTIRGYR